jgi:hypothetical protein
MAVRSAESGRLGSAGTSPASGSAALAAVGATAIALAFAVSPAQVESGPIVCPFRLVTGLPCPGCGLTRSWVYLAHGDFSEALRANPFGYVTMAAAAVLIVAVLAALVRGRPLPPMSRVIRTRPFAAAVGLWLAFAVVRIIVVASG